MRWSLILGILMLTCGCVPDNLMQESVTFSESNGTLWVRSCDPADRLKEVELYRNDEIVWSYRLIGTSSVSLTDGVDVRSVSASSAYSSTDQTGMAWTSGDVIYVTFSSGGVLGFQLGVSNTIGLDELRARSCPRGA